MTTEHRDMWLGSLPVPQYPPVYLEIVMYYPVMRLSAVKIWNYNKSVRDATKGIKDI